MKKTLGLDVGIASVGWAIIDDNNENVNFRDRLFVEIYIFIKFFLMLQ